MAKKRGTTAKQTSTTDEPTVTAPSDSDTRNAALVGDDDDEGPANAREYFARCNRPLESPATLEDVCGVLEAFGVTELPEGYATPHRLRQ
jgi:hypothetical protein